MMEKLKLLLNLKPIRFKCLSLLFAFIMLAISSAYGQYYKVEYQPSTQPGELQLGVTYTLWVPEGVKTIRGIIVHQHGAGIPAAKSGEYAAYDLHWQALARKWDCALLGPSYHVTAEKMDAAGGSQLWFDPKLGSEKAFLKAIDDLAAKTDHPELSTVPWVLWGHSAGAVWSDIMTMLHPDRVAVLWLRSGCANMGKAWKGFPEMQAPEAAYSIPTMCNAGIQEKNGIGASQMRKFEEYRSKNAPICFAFDPLTGHWTGNSRYLAIPFIDKCMALRMPEKGSKSQALRPIDMKKAWIAPVDSGQVVPVNSYKGDLAKVVWLPSQEIGKLWKEYVTTGQVSDKTPPPAPFNVKVADLGKDGTEITWDAEADFESGIGHFIVFRDGQELGNLPAVNLVRFQVRPNFQAGWIESYNDAPANPVPVMKFIDSWPKDNQKHVYTIVTVNTVGLRSKPSESVSTLPPAK
jgi:hypothetical protein